MEKNKSTTYLLLDHERPLSVPRVLCKLIGSIRAGLQILKYLNWNKSTENNISGLDHTSILGALELRDLPPSVPMLPWESSTRISAGCALCLAGVCDLEPKTMRNIQTRKTTQEFVNLPLKSALILVSSSTMITSSRASDRRILAGDSSGGSTTMGSEKSNFSGDLLGVKCSSRLFKGCNCLKVRAKSLVSEAGFTSLSALSSTEAGSFAGSVGDSATWLFTGPADSCTGASTRDIWGLGTP